MPTWVPTLGGTKMTGEQHGETAMTRAEWDAMTPRQRDALVAEKVMGTPFRKPSHGTCCSCQDCGHFYDECLCGFTTTPNGMMAVMEKMSANGFAWYLYGDHPDRIQAEFMHSHDGRYGVADTRLAPEAVCIAALIALGYLEEVSPFHVEKIDVETLNIIKKWQDPGPGPYDLSHPKHPAHRMKKWRK